VYTASPRENGFQAVNYSMFEVGDDTITHISFLPNQILMLFMVRSAFSPELVLAIFLMPCLNQTLLYDVCYESIIARYEEILLELLLFM
jgi:hypothetical protein